MGSNEKDGGRVEAIEDQQSLESNEIEKSKVGIMRALVEREDPSSKVLNWILFRLFIWSPFLLLTLCFHKLVIDAKFGWSLSPLLLILLKV